MEIYFPGGWSSPDRFLAGLGFIEGDSTLAATGGSEYPVRSEGSMESIE